MKTLKKIILLLAGIMVYTSAFSQIKTTELKKAGSNKIVVKIRFFNGSVVDPNGKEGLTNITASLMMEGGTAEFTKSQINELIRADGYVDGRGAPDFAAFVRYFRSEFKLNVGAHIDADLVAWTRPIHSA